MTVPTAIAASAPPTPEIRTTLDLQSPRSAPPNPTNRTTGNFVVLALARLVGAAGEVDLRGAIVVRDGRVQADAIGHAQDCYGDILRPVVLMQLGVVVHRPG